LSLTEIIIVIAVGNLLVAQCLMITCAGQRCTRGGVDTIHPDSVLIVMVAMLKMEMAIVQVINMALVFNGQMTALLSMNMWMLAGMGKMLHSTLLSKQNNRALFLSFQHSMRQQSEPQG
jgi:hypothetical protein